MSLKTRKLNDKIKNETPSPTKSIRKLINELSSTSTCHPVSKLFKKSTNESRLINALWLITMLVSVSFCFFVIVNSFIEFLQYDVVTHDQVIYQFNAQFPTITICNKDPFVTKNANDYLYNYLVSKNVTNFDELDNDKTNFDDVEKYYYEALRTVFASTESKKRKLGLSLNQMIMKCKFNGKDCDIRNDFVWLWIPEYGNCFRFNSGLNSNGQTMPIKEINTSSKKKSLELQLFIGFKNESEIKLNYQENSNG
jgi:hypothetical protein